MAQVDTPVGAVLVIGGGIGGIQAALDLGSLGFRVYLVERAPRSGARWPSSIRPFPPLIVPYEYSGRRWRMPVGIPISGSSRIAKWLRLRGNRAIIR